MGTYSEGKEERAYDITKKLLLERPDLNGIVGLNEPSTVGAGRAIRELGLAGKVKLVGFDSSVKEVKRSKRVLQSTIVQKPFNIGYLGIKTAISIIEGDKVLRNVYTDSVVINKDNMYTEENQKRSFPLWKSSFFLWGLLTDHRLFNTDQRIFHSSIGDRFVQ